MEFKNGRIEQQCKFISLIYNRFEGNMKDDIAEEYGKYVSDNGHW